MNRFRDANKQLFYFQNEILVICPHCQCRALVVKDKPGTFYTERTLKCTGCFYSSKGRKESFSVELNCHCSSCAAELRVILPDVNERKQTLAVKCRECNHTENYEPRNIPLVWQYPYDGEPTDGYFRLPLWLSEDFRGNTFWAFNYEHLDYLKRYISADLRERNDRKYWTMVEKLPEWIKSAKNRGKLLKLIDKLERK